VLHRAGRPRILDVLADEFHFHQTKCRKNRIKSDSQILGCVVGTCGGDAEHVDGWMRWYTMRYCDLTPTTSWSLSMAASEANEEETARTAACRGRGEVREAEGEDSGKCVGDGEPGVRLEEDVRAVH